MARSGFPTMYDFPDPLMPSMKKTNTWTQFRMLSSQKSLGSKGRSASAGQLNRSKSPEKSKAFVRSKQQALPKLVPDHIRKEVFRLGTPDTGPMGNANLTQVRKYFEFKGYIEGGENRAVTLEQLMHIYNYVEAKCGEWRLTLTEATYYHVKSWLIEPATAMTNSALFEHVGEKAQTPTWFLSHWWGEPIVNVTKCIQRHFAVRTLPSHAAYWICAYALRQEDFAEDISNVRQTSFYKALHYSKFKMLLIFDISGETTGPATPLKRIWCVFECAMCLDQGTAPLDIAVAVPDIHDPVRLVCSGLTKTEKTKDGYLSGKGAANKIKRERPFPENIVKASLAFNVKLATASSHQDRAKILNFIAGRPKDVDPLREHEKYEQLNKRTCGLFSQVFLHRALSMEKPDPRKEEARKQFMGHLGHLSKAIAGDTWRTSMSLCLAGTNLDSESLHLVVKCLPPNLINLSFNFQNTILSDEALEAMVEFLPKHVQVLSFDLSGCAQISDNGVFGFVQNLSTHVKTLNFSLAKTQASPFLMEVCRVETLAKLRDRAATHGMRPAAQRNNPANDPQSLDHQSEDRQSLLESILRTKISDEVRAKILQDLIAAGQSGDRLMMNQKRQSFAEDY